MEHIQQMGEGNASLNRQLHVGKDTMLAMAALYQGRDRREVVIIIIQVTFNTMILLTQSTVCQ